MTWMEYRMMKDNQRLRGGEITHIKCPNCGGYLLKDEVMFFCPFCCWTFEERRTDENNGRLLADM